MFFFATGSRDHKHSDNPSRTSLATLYLLVVRHPPSKWCWEWAPCILSSRRPTTKTGHCALVHHHSNLLHGNLPRVENKSLSASLLHKPVWVLCLFMPVCHYRGSVWLHSMKQSGKWNILCTTSLIAVSTQHHLEIFMLEFTRVE